ncbi:MAG: LytTR family DNA-binding domain-containing protein [Chitinophagaceae bacterium]
MIRCFVLDDEPSSVELMEKYVGRTSVLSIAGTETDAIKGLGNILKLNPNLVFLDVEMPGCSGMDIAAQLPATCKVIFTTAYRNYAADAYDLNAVDFLSKPFSYQRFMVAVNKYLNTTDSKNEKTRQSSNFIFVPNGNRGERIKIDTDKIVQVEAQEHYSVLTYEDGKSITVWLSISEMERRLPEHFLRVQRSFIANMEKVECVKGGELLFSMDGKSVKYGREYALKIKTFLRAV